MMRSVQTAVRIAATLLVASLPGWGSSALADKPEPFEKGTGKYILVLKDSRTEVDDPVTGKKKARDPDVVRHGGQVLYKKDGTRIIKLPAKAARALAAEENVAYLQRIWLGEPADEWDSDELASSIKADSVLETQDINLTWETGQYQYDGSGNIKQIGDDTYVYDALGRLKTAVVNGLTATYQYDSFGNLVGQTVNGVTRSTPVDTSSNRLQGETYDAAGNLTTQEGTPVYNYDSFSMIDHIDKRRSGTITQQRILYGPDDERIGIVLDEGVLSRWKIRDFSGKVLREYRANDDGNFWQWMEDYVYSDGRLLGADRHEYYGGQRHFHLDHLGTVRMITDQNRQRISVHEFYPFGVEQTDATQEHNRIFNGTAGSGTDHRSEPMKFTSHERDWHGWLNVDNDEYLDYMHARYYDPNLGRFLSVDPGGMDPRDPQTWNRYSYAKNNPLRYTDPDGRNFMDYLTGVANGYSSSLLFNINRVQAPNADFAVGQTVGDAIALAQGVQETISGATIAGGSGLLTALSGGTGTSVTAPAAAGGVVLMAHGGASSVVALSNLQSQMSKVGGLEKQVKAHEQKLADYKSNPDGHDNKGFLKDKTPEQRQKIIDSRIRSLQHQIDTFKKKIEEILRTTPEPK